MCACAHVFVCLQCQQIEDNKRKNNFRNLPQDGNKTNIDEHDQCALRRFETVDFTDSMIIQPVIKSKVNQVMLTCSDQKVQVREEFKDCSRTLEP